MLCRDIYITALKLIGEPYDGVGTADYSARAPELLTTVFQRFAYISDSLNGVESDYSTLIISSLDTAYPLDIRLYSVCATALASLLILDEIPEISKTLDKLATSEATKISREAVTAGGTREVYGI